MRKPGTGWWFAPRDYVSSLLYVMIRLIRLIGLIVVFFAGAVYLEQPEGQAGLDSVAAQIVIDSFDGHP